MEIKYTNESIKNKLDDDTYLKKTFGVNVKNKFIDFKKIISSSRNFDHLKRTNKGLRIEKLRIGVDKFSARLNKQYRVEFYWKKENEIIIEIIRIHKHKY